MRRPSPRFNSFSARSVQHRDQWRSSNASAVRSNRLFDGVSSRLVLYSASHTLPSRLRNSEKDAATGRASARSIGMKGTVTIGVGLPSARIEGEKLSTAAASETEMSWDVRSHFVAVIELNNVLGPPKDEPARLPPKFALATVAFSEEGQVFRW